MTQKKKQKTKQDTASELNELLIQAVKTGVVLAEKGLSYAEDAAHKKKLFKTYPYLDRAFANVKNVISFFQESLNPARPRKAKKNERTKRAKRTKSDKKVSK